MGSRLNTARLALRRAVYAKNRSTYSTHWGKLRNADNPMITLYSIRASMVIATFATGPAKAVMAVSRRMCLK